MIKPTTRVYRKEIVEGYSVPAIINNGGSYFFTDIDVYENGRVSCWHMEDFEHFVRDVIRGWVSMSIPDGKQISIHALGQWTVSQGNWLFTKDTFVEYVMGLVRDLNPEMQNLYTYIQKTVKGVGTWETGDGTVYKEVAKYENDIFPDKVPGEGVHLFYKLNGQYWLVNAMVFKDRSLRLGRLENPVDLTLEAFNDLVQQGIILSEIPLGATVHIYGLGSFAPSAVGYVEKIENKVLELEDLMRQLNNEPTTLELCRQALETYRQDPTRANRDLLKTAYERIPEHDRPYVGDMDIKDTEVRMILYGEQEIENWSHYQVAKHQGADLPTISIPKPKD
jgi:hypothetical protein